MFKTAKVVLPKSGYAWPYSSPSDLVIPKFSGPAFELEGELFPPKDHKLLELWKKLYRVRNNNQGKGLNAVLHIGFPEEYIIPQDICEIGTSWKWYINDVVQDFNLLVASLKGAEKQTVQGYKLHYHEGEWWVVHMTVTVQGPECHYEFEQDRSLISGNILVYHVNEELMRYEYATIPLTSLDPEYDSSATSKRRPTNKATITQCNSFFAEAYEQYSKSMPWKYIRSAHNMTREFEVPRTIQEYKRLYTLELRTKLKFRHHELVADSNPYKHSDRTTPLNLNMGLYHAWDRAVSKIPVASNNSFANIKAAREGLLTMLFGDKENWAKPKGKKKPGDLTIPKLNLKIPDSKATEALRLFCGTSEFQFSKDLWLQGRYAWTPNWADAGGTWKLFNELMQQQFNPFWKSYVHGTYTDDDGITYRCGFQYKERAMEAFGSDGLRSIFAHAYKWGLQPNLEVLWDFIPYSFVVDWALPIGDWLAANDRAMNYGTQYYEFHDGFCFSTTYDINFTYGGRAVVYCRWYDSEPPYFDVGETWNDFLNDSTKTKTKVFRAVDSILLLTNFL